jgi:hypothetical protein
MSLKVHEIAGFEFYLRIYLDIFITHFVAFNSTVNCLRFFEICVGRVFVRTRKIKKGFFVILIINICFPRRGLTILPGAS